MSNVNSNENVSRLLYIYKVGISIGCAICTALCAISSLLFYDHNPGYFVSNIPTTILQVFIAVSVLFTSTVMVTMPKTVAINSPMSKDSIPAVSIIPACAFIYYAISLIPALFLSGNTQSVYILLTASTLISFIYFFMRTLDVKLNTSALSLLGTASIISPIIIAVISYFDYKTVMNGPDKILLEFSCVIFCLLIINEVRFIWDSGIPKLFITISGISSIVSLTCAANRICLLTSNRELVSAENVALAVFFALIGAYSLIRVWLTKAYIPEEPEIIVPESTEETQEIDAPLAEVNEDEIQD